MKNHFRHISKRCQALALAGMLTAGTFAPAGTAWAIGPGEVSTGTVNTGPGAAAAQTAQSTQTTQTTQTASDSGAWKKSGGYYRMPDGTAIENVLRRGIDVSRWQGDINWQQVAADDVSFVMLGTRSSGAVDPYFHKNIREATAAGVQAGVYIYSLATTPEMAVEEADFVLDLIKGYPISYPVAFDMEDSTQGSLSKEQLAQIANAFCQRISDAGYYPIIYANDNWLANKLDLSLMDYPVWVARYSKRPDYASPVLWQATNTGSVSGISGNVDIDFQFEDFTDEIPRNTWRTIGGKSYYYQDYALQTNTWIYDGDGWYYMDGEGLALTGWQTINSQRYFLGEDTGKMEYGWKQDQGSWYYLGSSGAVDKGWVNDNGTWYYTDEESGIMQTGWLQIGGKRYYLDDSGRMQTGWLKQGDQWYYLDGSGALSSGWINDNETWYYANSEGVMQTGWLQDGGTWYYLKGDGSRASGWREMGGVWYYFDSQGRMATGWQMIDNTWYWFSDSGAMATGLIQVAGVSYYLNDSGAMAANTTVTVNGTVYNADGSGALTPADLSQTAPQGDAAPAPAAGETSSEASVTPVTEGAVSAAPAAGGSSSAAPSGSQGNSQVSLESPSISAPKTGVDGGPGVS